MGGREVGRAMGGDGGELGIQEEMGSSRRDLQEGRRNKAYTRGWDNSRKEGRRGRGKGVRRDWMWGVARRSMIW